MEYDPDIQADVVPEVEPLTDYLKLDLKQGWTYVDVHSKDETEKAKSTWIGLVGNDGKNIISVLAVGKNDLNVGDKRLPSSEIMYQALMSKGNKPSEFQNVIRAPVANKGSLQMMRRAVEAKYPNADMQQPYSFIPADNNFDDLVGDYVCKLPELLSPFSWIFREIY